MKSIKRNLLHSLNSTRRKTAFSGGIQKLTIKPQSSFGGIYAVSPNVSFDYLKSKDNVCGSICVNIFIPGC